MFLTETRVPKANVNSPVSGMFWITHVADYQPTGCSSSLPQLLRKRQIGIDLLVKSSSLPVLVLSDELLGSTDKDWLFALQKTSAAQTEPSSEHNLHCEPPGQLASDFQHRLHAWPRANIVPQRPHYQRKISSSKRSFGHLSQRKAENLAVCLYSSMAKSITCGMRDLGWMKCALSYIRVLESAGNTLQF